MIELLDFSDEMILTIMHKIQYRTELLCSIIGIGNNHLEQLALAKCQSIDLIFVFTHSPYELLIQRFYSHLIPRIYYNIQSLTLSLQHLLRIVNFANGNRDRTLPNLTHLKIMFGKQCCETDAPCTLGIQLYLFSVSIAEIRIDDVDIMSKMASMCCPNLKILTMIIYRNISCYEACIPPLLQRLSNVEHLTLLLAVDVIRKSPNHFIDGFDIDEDIVSYMLYFRS
ncbi:unnamed protein product [Rotaria sp. Silwood1]|nr:unnamed protein product [Rotaria sp. Silwood1]